jgi:FHA domain
MADCSYCLQTLPAGATRCPRCGTAVQQDAAERYERSGTVMERVSDLQDAIRSATVKEATVAKSEPPPRGKADQKGTVGFRPVFRAPMALLTVLDDGRRDRGEAIRIRQERTVIGRVDGEVLVPHDNGVSGKHAEIVREMKDGHYHWTLRDLESRNGTFVRVSKAALQHNQHLILGGKRYRFDAAPQGTEAVNTADAAGDETGATRPWQAVSPADLSKLIPSLVELGAQGEGERHLLDRAENAVGGDPRQCNVVLADDPFVSPLHARVTRDDRGRWSVTNNDSLNGVWLKVDAAPMNDDGEFQLGEQRFSLKIL